MLYALFVKCLFVKCLIKTFPKPKNHSTFFTLTLLGFFSFFRPLLKDIKSSNEHRIILDCKTDNIYEIFKQAQQVGVMTAYDNFFVTSLVWYFLSFLTSIVEAKWIICYTASILRYKYYNFFGFVSFKMYLRCTFNN